jgi:hypothetical protein
MDLLKEYKTNSVLGNKFDPAKLAPGSNCPHRFRTNSPMLQPFPCRISFKLAKEILIHTHDSPVENRSIKRKNVDYLTMQLDTEAWTVIPEGIVFGDAALDYILLDGQHRIWSFIKHCIRLMAEENVAESDLPELKTSYATGWTVSEREKSGRGVPRTQRDQFNISRELGTEELSGRSYQIASHWISSDLDLPDHDWLPINMIPEDEFKNFIEDNRDIIDDVSHQLRSGISKKKNMGIFTAVVKYYKQNPVKGKELITMLTSGANMGPTHPILRLRATVLESKGGGGGQHAVKQFYGMAIYCIDKFHFGKSCSVVRQPYSHVVNWDLYKESASGSKKATALKQVAPPHSPSRKSKTAAKQQIATQQSYDSVDASTKSVTQMEKGSFNSLTKTPAEPVGSPAEPDPIVDLTQSDWLETYIRT